MLSTRDPPRNKGHIQTESEGLEKDILCKRDQKKAGVVILISDKIDFKTKGCEKRQRWTLHYDQRINPRRYNNYKYTCTNIGAPQYVRQMLTSMKGEINSNTINSGRL